MRKYLLVFPVFFILNFALAQNAPVEYQRAKSLLSSKNYWEAMPLFREFLDEDEYGSLSNYAAFHLAEAALGANQPAVAIEALKSVAMKNWPKSDESKYLLGLAFFQNQQNLEALQVFKMIKKPNVLELAENASYENLKKTSASFLVANLQEFKENAGFRVALKTVLESQTILSSTERAAYHELQGKAQETTSTVAKDQILDIVVILPFTNSNTASITSVSPSDFVFELYQGIEFGVEQLKASGQKINLITFDSKRDVAHLQNLLKDPAIAKADVIIGPIYPEETDLVSAFAETSRIPVINPLSNLGERFNQMKYSYLFRPSVPSLSAGIIKGVKQQAWGKKVAIGYSASSRDEKLGLLLKDELSKLGYTVTKAQKIDAKNVGPFLQGLGVRRGNTPTVDQVILLTDDPGIAQPTFALMESISTSVPLLVMDSWLGFNFANYEMLEFPNFFFIGNNTTRFDTEEMHKFRADFYNRYLIYPSLNSIQGNELVNWLQSNISPSLGMDLRRSLDQKSFQAGKYSWGQNFRESNNNTYVPVFRLESGELKPIE
jgi:tetratricopeptide (TPR) repeat protein